MAQTASSELLTVWQACPGVGTNAASSPATAQLRRRPPGKPRFCNRATLPAAVFMKAVILAGGLPLCQER